MSPAAGRSSPDILEMESGGNVSKWFEVAGERFGKNKPDGTTTREGG